VQEIREVLSNEHLNRFAGVLAIAQAPGWRRLHPQVADVRGRLDRLARIIRGGETFDQQAFLSEWTTLFLEIVSADPALFYTESDMDWLIQTLESGPQAGMVLLLLLAAASASPRWYSAEQLAEITGLSAVTWRKRAAHPENPWMAQKRGKTWLFNELVLRARGVEVPPSMRIEKDEG
jgi:hypothetical protein